MLRKSSFCHKRIYISVYLTFLQIDFSLKCLLARGEFFSQPCSLYLCRADSDSIFLVFLLGFYIYIYVILYLSVLSDFFELQYLIILHHMVLDTGRYFVSFWLGNVFLKCIYVFAHNDFTSDGLTFEFILSSSVTFCRTLSLKRLQVRGLLEKNIYKTLFAVSRVFGQKQAINVLQSSGKAELLLIWCWKLVGILYTGMLINTQMSIPKITLTSHVCSPPHISVHLFIPRLWEAAIHFMSCQYISEDVLLNSPHSSDHRSFERVGEEFRLSAVRRNSTGSREGAVSYLCCRWSTGSRGDAVRNKGCVGKHAGTQTGNGRERKSGK